MQIQFDDVRPIFLQIAEWLEDAILSGAFAEESQIPSITEIASTVKINPATALKGINLLVEEGLLYKKRGLGMFVSTSAQEKIRNRRKQQFFEDYAKPLLAEAARLQISKAEILQMITEGGGSNEH